MTTRHRLLSTALIALLMSPALAWAHGGDAPHTHAGLLEGFLHPFTGLDHLLVMVGVGAWSALAVRPVWLGPAAFLAVLTAGALAGMAGVSLPATEPLVAASALVMGLLLAARLQLPAGIAAALVAGFAFFHGLAHGADLGGSQPVRVLLGMLAATALLHGLGLLAAPRLLARHRWIAAGAGSGMAAMGVVFLARLA